MRFSKAINRDRSSRNSSGLVATLAIDGGDHAKVDTRVRLVVPGRLDFAVLEKPRLQRLHGQAHLANLVEKQPAAMRELELAALVAAGAGARSGS